jgi:phosphoribosylaminoimidazole (AIR) synthetase
MGIGLVLMVAPDDAAAVRDAIPEALTIGRIAEDTGRRVELKGLQSVRSNP